MKKLVIVLMLHVTTFLIGQAQTAKPQLTDEQKKELRAKMDAYKAKLNLSEEQEAKVETINMDFLEALSKIKEEGGTRLNKYKKFKQASSAKDKKMKEALTADQYKIYKEQQEEFKDEIKARRGN